MLKNIDSSVLVLAYIGICSLGIAAVGIYTHTARAEEGVVTETIGERHTYVENGATITVEPGVLVLHN